MADAVKTIRINIEAAGSEAGARRVNKALESIGKAAGNGSSANDNHAGSFNRLTNAMAGTGKAGEAVSKVFEKITSAGAEATPMVGKLVESLASISPQTAIIAGVALAIAAIGTESIKAAAEVQSWKASLTTVTGSTQKAEASYKSLVNFANTTPFDTKQSVEAFIKLRSLGLGATEERLNSFGNTASAMGKSLNQMIEAVADASTGEFERLKEFGIKAKQNNDTVAFTFQGTTTIVKKSAGDITRYLEDIGNKQFAGAMARQMDTLNGAFSNVGDSVQQMLATMGGGALGDAVKSVAQTIAAGISGITPLLGSIANVIGSIIGTVGKAINGVVGLFTAITTGGQGVTPALTLITNLLNGIAAVVTMVGKTIGDAFGLATTAITNVQNGIRNFLGLNQEAAKGTAGWTEIFQASWDAIGQGWDSLIGKAQTWAKSLVDDTSKTLSAWAGDLGSYFAAPISAIKAQFSGLTSWLSSTFGDLSFNAEGIVTGAARVVDLVIGAFRGGVNVIEVLWQELPDAIWQSLSPGMQTILKGIWDTIQSAADHVKSVFNAVLTWGQELATEWAKVFNSILSFVEEWANKAINGLNTVLSKAKSIGINVDPVANVDLGQVAGPKLVSTFAAIGTKASAAFKAGFGHDAESLTKGLIAKARTLGGQGAAGLDAGSDQGTASKSKDKADKAAERRAKREKEFWDTLKNEAEAAKMLPVAAEAHRKELELQKILGRDLTATEKQRVDNAVQLVEASKFLGEAAKTHADNVAKAGAEEEALKARIAGQTSAQQTQESQLVEFRNKALLAGVDIKGQEYLAAEKVYQTDLARLAAVTKINEQLDTAAKLAGQYSLSYQRQQAQKDFTTNMAAVQTGLEKGTITPQQYREIVDGLKQSMADVANTAREKFGQRITELGELIGTNWGAALGKLGKVLSGIATAAKGDSFSGLGAGGAVMDLFGRKLDGSLNNLGTSFKTSVQGFGDNLFKSATWTKPLESMSSGFSDFKGSLGQIFGKGGDLMKGLGSVLGNAMSGASLGGAIGSVLGLDSTGSTLGGAVGSALGPLGSIAGSVVGGLLGGLFKKAPSGSVVINSASGDNSITSNNAKVTSNLTSLGSSVQETITKMASSLGADLGSFAVSIGQYKDNYRVSASGSSAAGNKRYPDSAGSDILYDGTDATQALKIAIQNAIQDGALVGLRASTKALLAASSDIETQLTKALTFENAFKELKTYLDPVGAAVDTVNTEMKNLISIFKEAGATSEEWSQLQQLQQIKMQQIIDQQTSSLKDIMNTLNGSASGKSALALLNDEMSQLDTYKAQIASGAQIDQSKYSTLVSDILTNAQSIYGNNSTEYQNLIAGLKDTTTGAIANVQSAYEAAIAAGGSESDPAATIAAMQAQTDAVTASLGVSNDYLAQIVAQLKANGASNAQIVSTVASSGISYAVVNGQLQYN